MVKMTMSVVIVNVGMRNFAMFPSRVQAPSCLFDACMRAAVRILIIPAEHAIWR